MTSETRERLKALERENRELRQARAISNRTESPGGQDIAQLQYSILERTARESSTRYSMAIVTELSSMTVGAVHPDSRNAATSASAPPVSTLLMSRPPVRGLAHAIQRTVRNP